MTEYIAPVRDLRFALCELDGFEALRALPAFAEATPELVEQVLDEAGRLAAREIAPFNRSGDEEGAHFENGVVRAAEGFADAYRRFVEGGWAGLDLEPEHGGQGLPRALATATGEMWNAANMAFALCPLLTHGAAELIGRHGNAEQKALYGEKLVSGEWTGTMCMTEPQAGSDVGAARTRARPENGHYRLSGTKIFITYGDHDMAENIVHLVLARTPGAPEGARGLSLFVVPKFLPDVDGRPGTRNDIRTVSIEHKLGVRASPTCTLAFGDGEGAIGTLIGEENRGIQAMFTMMNSARLAVGLQGVAIAERAYQQALAFARERRQGRRLTDGAPAVIIDHPDVRRMLMTMKAHVEAMRALALRVAIDIDLAAHHDDAETRARRQRRVDLLIPVVKAYCSDTGFAVASLGVQIHGGMGYIEETGAAQHLRDARIAMIYEGTNGIQALDLAGRKLLGDKGAAARAYLADVEVLEEQLGAAGLDAIRAPLARARETLARASDWLIETWAGAPGDAAAGASDYLRLFGLVASGAMMGESALAAARRLAEGGADDAFYHAKLATARFHAATILPGATALLDPIRAGSDGLDALD